LTALKNSLDLKNLTRYCNFLGHLSHGELAQSYKEADLCLFSSKQQSGFSRVPLEAIASGCLLFSYGNEGSNIFINDRIAFDLRLERNEFCSTIREFQLHPEKYQNHLTKSREYVQKNYSISNYLNVLTFEVKAIYQN
jgi:glycosyltransferase involved in cell wall biosynthesis